MATSSCCQNIVHTTSPYVMWLLFLTVARLITVSESLTSKEPIQLRGHVGGEAVFYCPVDQHKTITYLYLQRRDVFVNGYYVSKNIDQYWTNTRVDRDKNAVYMLGLNMSHAGLYTCHIQYNDTEDGIERDIQLIVTANYSKPTVQYSKCNAKEEHCQVVCSSYGGYPERQILWNVTGTEKPTSTAMWKILSSTEESDKDTMLFNVSSTASFNCSAIKHNNVSCSLDGVTSVFSICEVQSSSPPHKPGLVYAAVSVCVVLAVIAVGLLICYRKHRKTKWSISGTTNIL